MICSPQVGAAFLYDVMSLVANRASNMLENNWKRINYVDCFSFNETDLEAMEQAKNFKDALQVLVHDLYD